MKPSTLFTSLLAVAITGTVADNCRKGYTYCANTLNAIGNYQGQIDQELNAKGFQGGDSLALFYCEGGSNGVIRLQEKCRSYCKQNGVKVNDVCG